MKNIIITLLITIVFFRIMHPIATIIVKADDSVELVFWNVESREPRNSISQEDINIFNTLNPTINIKAVYIDSDTYKMKVKVALAGNQMPDIIYSWPGELFNTMIEAGALTDLTEKIESKSYFKSKFLPASFEQTTYKGRIYGIPINFNSVVIWYNKEIFKDNQIDIPKNWDELLLIVDQLNTSGLTPIAIGSKEGWPILYWFSYLSQRIGGKELFQQAITGKEDFTHPVFIETADKLKTLKDRGGFTKDFLEKDSEAAEERFTTGKAAMYMQGDWSLLSLLKDLEFSEKIGFFPFPEIKDGQGSPDIVYGGINGILAISQNTDLDTAFKFIEYNFIFEKNNNSTIKKDQPLPIMGIKGENINPLVNKYTDFINSSKGFFGYYDQQLGFNRTEKLLNAIQIILKNNKVDIEYVLSKVE